MATIRCAYCGTEVNADAVGCPDCGAHPRTGAGGSLPSPAATSSLMPRTPVPSAPALRLLLALPPLALSVAMVVGFVFLARLWASLWGDTAPNYAYGLFQLFFLADLVVFVVMVDAAQLIIRGRCGRWGWARLLVEGVIVGVPLAWVLGFPFEASAYRSPLTLSVVPFIYVACLALFRIVGRGHPRAA